MERIFRALRQATAAAFPCPDYKRRGDTMVNNYLISQRDAELDGTPNAHGNKVSAYIEIPDTALNYNLQRTLTKDQWLSRISSTSVLVFVHGYANSSSDVVARHNTIRPHVPPGFSLVTFDWASGNPPPTAYDNDKVNAGFAGHPFVVNCLKVLVSKFGAANVHVFAHSMGAYVTERAFQVPNATKVNHVVMAAADVDQLNYQSNSGPLNTFLSNCTDLTAYWSTDDSALQDSELKNKYTPLGLKGHPEPDTPVRCSGIQCSTYYGKYVKPVPPPVPAKEFSHVWYILYQPSPPSVNDFYTDMNKVLQGPPLPLPASPSPTRALGFVLRRP
jgi:Alpha/beta hydrolase of unknown function (DUF900)